MASEQERAELEKEYLYLHPSDHPGLLPKPAAGSKNLEKWKRVDLMITSWLWNSIAKEILGAYMYAASSRNLWLELQRRYGSSNGPMIYQIRRDISSVNQGNLSLTTYFTNLKQLWNEVLMMDPLPDLEKAFSMVMSVEKQRSVHTELAENTNNVAYQLVMKENMRDHAEKPVFKRRQYVDKKSLTCVHCHKTGHTKDSCFKLHGVPEWYTSLTEQKKKGASGGKGFVANVDVKQQSEQGTQLNVAANQSNMSALVSELLKMVKSANTQPTDPLHVDYANYVEYNEDFAAVRIKFCFLLILREMLHFAGPAGDVSCSVSAKCNSSIWHQSTTPHKSKFQKRAHKCILIGYAMHKKAYKLFDITLNQVVFSRDVVFYEHIFPYASTATPPSSIPLPIAPNICSDDSVSTSDSPIQPSSSNALDSPAHIPQSSDILATTPLSNTESLHSTHLSPQPLRRSKATKYPEWRRAMQEEIQALEHNKTWRITHLPDGKKAIGYKWVYKLKLKADGSVDRYKARLVAKGYNQIEGIDYTDSFSLVAKVVTVWLFLNIATSHGWPIHQLDVNNAFLHGYLDEDLYMVPPEGYLVEPGMAVKCYLHDLFTIKDIGEARYFLGLEIARNNKGSYVAQTKYILDIVKDTGLLEAKAASTPLPQGLKLTSDCGALLQSPDSYRRLVGRLLYLNFTRPDISHSVQQLSQFLNHPCVHLQVFAYFLEQLLFLGKQRSKLRSRSTAEAEYRSMAAAVCEIRWISFLLRAGAAMFEQKQNGVAAHRIENS
ncbi:UNVERIFIED_CONTAM: Retrovirus-related Pol polyprotein from transposon RE1 [Sesamum calycinum]|uniref:Retrovirus-related Pol polyprotein from transposon RE1 n=1 Tax=Sesamum calycinum TaxID=2727403 RepID=A0AAW2Q7C4_9LAMI